MNYDFDKAPTSASHCINCKQIIEKDDVRLVEYDDFNGRTTKKFRCSKCGINWINDEISELQVILDNLTGISE